MKRSSPSGTSYTKRLRCASGALSLEFQVAQSISPLLYLSAITREIGALPRFACWVHVPTCLRGLQVSCCAAESQV